MGAGGSTRGADAGGVSAGGVCGGELPKGVSNSSDSDVSFPGSGAENFLPDLKVDLLGVDVPEVGALVDVGLFLPYLPDVLSRLLDAV